MGELRRGGVAAVSANGVLGDPAGANAEEGWRLLDRLAADLGPDVVRRIRVHGPTAPDWRHGPLRVTGRGPRDTYG
jgi:creatinine amidohydrolase/Fe(II)-dependent formamide hydrolase-like protein